MTEIEKSVRRLMEVLRSGHPDDIISKEYTTMVFAEGYQVGATYSAMKILNKGSKGQGEWKTQQSN